MNSLTTIAPDVARYWDRSKNAKAPEQVLAGSNFRAEWKCPSCKWEWQAPTGQCVRLRTGCPKCSRARRRSISLSPHLPRLSLPVWLSVIMVAMILKTSLLTTSVLAATRWCTGSAGGVQEGRHTAGTAASYNRVGKGRGCPACAGKQACACNSSRLYFHLLRLMLMWIRIALGLPR